MGSVCLSRAAPGARRRPLAAALLQYYLCLTTDSEGAHAAVMDSLIVHNGNVLPLGEARLSPGQAGLLLGWGVFTTLRIYSGRPFAFDRHWQRMSRDASRLSVELPVSESELLASVIELVQKNQRAEGMARASFIRNSGGAWAGPAERPVDWLVFTEALNAWPDSYRLLLQPRAVYSNGVLAGAKMLSWAANSSFHEKARAAGCDDALLLNEVGNVTECTSANIFIAAEGKLITPPLSSGCLPGVTREMLLNARRDAGFEIAEAEITLESLKAADEVFITSTTREVGGVREIVGVRDYPPCGPLTGKAKEIFRRLVEPCRKP